MPRFEGDVVDRAFQLAVRIVKICVFLQDNRVGRTLADQLLRSGTSIGANLEEGQGARTKKEFRHKVNIAKGEALETRYWLRLVVAAELIPGERLQGIQDELDEIIKILYAIMRKVRES